MMTMKIVEREDVMTDQLAKELAKVVRRANGLGSRKKVQLTYTSKAELICHYRKLKTLAKELGLSGIEVKRKKLNIYVYREGKRPYTKPKPAAEHPVTGAQS